MTNENEKRIYDIIDQIPITDKNKKQIEEIKMAVQTGDYKSALARIKELNAQEDTEIEDIEEVVDENNDAVLFSKELSDPDLEYRYMGLLLENPKSISRYYFLYGDCYFEDDKILNVYKSVLFTEGGRYTPEIAKDGFNFSKDSEEVYRFKNQLKKNVRDKNYDMEKTYTELKKIICTKKRIYD